MFPWLDLCEETWKFNLERIHSAAQLQIKYLKIE